MGKPHKRIIKCRYNQVDKVKEEMACFGYEQEECITRPNDVNVKLVLVRREINNPRKVAIYEHHFDSVNRLSFVGTIIWLLIAASLIICYYMLKTFQFRVMFLYIGIPCAGMGILLFITRLILFLNKNKYRTYIMKEARKYCGNSRLKPVPENILPEDENSNLIRDNLKNIKLQ